jgi:hypothetical protein
LRCVRGGRVGVGVTAGAVVAGPLLTGTTGVEIVPEGLADGVVCCAVFAAGVAEPEPHALSAARAEIDNPMTAARTGRTGRTGGA